MRSAVGKALLTGFLLIVSGELAKAQSKFETCFGPLSYLETPIQCVTDKNEGVKIQLVQKNIILEATKPGSYPITITVNKAQLLPPRIEDSGYIDQSLRFIAQGSVSGPNKSANNKNTARTLTLAFECGQKSFAYIGVGVGDQMPEEQFAQCQPIQSPKNKSPK